jgi:cysteine-rich repeat protein
MRAVRVSSPGLLAICCVTSFLVGCTSPSTQTCGADGPTCPSGWVCIAELSACVNPNETLCANGVLDDGEACDDGNYENHDTCNWDCQLPRCGDGFQDGDETCDDSNNFPDDGCAANCGVEACGNGVIDGADEQCDAGADNGTTDCGCRTDCLFAEAGAACGDDDACNGADSCDGQGACDTAAPPDCDDASTATADACFPESGCAHLRFAAALETELRGNVTGGTLHEDACPPGQVMIGFAGATGASFDQLQVVCGLPALAGDHQVTIGAGDTLPLRGINAGTPVSSSCAAGEFVVGFEGRAGALVDQLALRCAPLLVTPNGAGYLVSLGTVTTGAVVGGTGGDAFPATDCPTGQLALGASIRAGGSIDAFGLRCGIPIVE